jgi:NAD(P)-dependent dehydrogenase (short-subunit alcohol dehydrogenase family)
VVVTGASSGIGRATALLLAARGFRVFAGVRRPIDGSAIENEGAGAVIAIQLDVTDRAMIERAAEAVRERLGGAGLYALVNNAGIAQPSPVEYLSDESLRRQFDVNVFGQIAVTQAFLPLIRDARGRIVNIGSVGSHIALPFGGALCASKAAFSSLSESLRLELRSSGIHVCLIEPGAIHTPAVDKTLGDPEQLIRSLPAEGVARYGDSLREFMRRGYSRESKGSPPRVVAEAVLHAITARRPRLRYVVGADARTMIALPRLLPERLLDRVRLRMLGLRSDFGGEARRAASVGAQ